MKIQRIKAGTVDLENFCQCVAVYCASFLTTPAPPPFFYISRRPKPSPDLWSEGELLMKGLSSSSITPPSDFYSVSKINLCR